MKIIALFTLIAVIAISSCQKETSVEPDNQPPATYEKDSLTVRTIKYTSFDSNGINDSYTDNFYLDTVMNTIKLIETYDNPLFYDSMVRIYYYNNKKQLTAIKDNGLPKIEFIRDISGKLLTTTTHYQNADVNESTGTFTYATQGTGIAITYLDSVLKFPGSNPYDARSFYKYTFSVDTTVNSLEEFYISTNGDYRKETYSYDNNKNLLTATTTDKQGNTKDIFSYLREPVKHTTYTSFLKRLGGDLFWFYQTKFLVIIPNIFNEFDYAFALSAPKKITYPKELNGTLFNTYNNTYDSKGNLVSTAESNDKGDIVSKTEITYNP